MVIHIKFPSTKKLERLARYERHKANIWLERCRDLIEENGSLRNRLSLAYAERGDREITLNKVIEERDQLKADNRMLTQHNSELRMMLAIASQRLRAMFLSQTSTKQ